LKRNKCKHYDLCNAQLCPMLSHWDLKKLLWYPDEDICKLKTEMPNWIGQQKKIASKVRPYNSPYYFTIDMLKVPFKVTAKVKGLDPDKNHSSQLSTWRKENMPSMPARMAA
jgi:hypothetical protein